MPPHPPHHHRKHKKRDEVSTDFIDHRGLDELLEPFVPNRADRAFIVRCLVDEGPGHHRGSNDVLLRLLARVDRRRPPDLANTVAVSMQLPPHLHDERGDDEDAAYPIALPLRPLALLAPDERARRAMVACLTHGPPQHVLANVVMLWLIDTLLAPEAPPNP